MCIVSGPVTKEYNVFASVRACKRCICRAQTICTRKNDCAFKAWKSSQDEGGETQTRLVNRTRLLPAAKIYIECGVRTLCTHRLGIYAY